jgi:hypothetical protein
MMDSHTFAEIWPFLGAAILCAWAIWLTRFR